MAGLYVGLVILGILMFFSVFIFGALFAYSFVSDKRRDEKEKINAPYHEAGHVILAIITGIGFKEVTVEGNNHNLGFMSYHEVQYARTRYENSEPLKVFTNRELLENSLLTSLAGYVAEMLTCGKKSLPTHKIKYSDMETVSEIIKNNRFLYQELSLSPDEYLHSLMMRTRTHLIEEAEAHLLISEALADSKTLTEREVWKLLCDNKLGKNLHNPYGLEDLSFGSVAV